MFLSSLDTLYFIGALCLLMVSGFLCWLLYEAARVLRQTNEVIEETRDKVALVEHFVTGLVGRVSKVSPYLGVLATAGKEIFNVVRDRKQRHKADEDSSDDEWAEAIVKKRRKKA